MPTIDKQRIILILTSARRLFRDAMKRSQASSPTSAEIPKCKKAKISTENSGKPTEGDDGGWTKVEKRKQKKAKKAEVKLDVCELFNCAEKLQASSTDVKFACSRKRGYRICGYNFLTRRVFTADPAPVHVFKWRDCETKPCYRD